MKTFDYVKSIPGFSNNTTTNKVKYFSWYLAKVCGKEEFTGTDILNCFQQAKFPKPETVSPYLKSLANRLDPFLIKSGRKYSLSHTAEEEYERSYGQREETIAVQALLSELPQRLSLDSERQYLEEALKCFRSGAFRATVVMTWNLTFDHLCNVILSKHESAFNTQLPKTYPKSDIKEIKHRDDFEGLKEHQVLQVAKSCRAITGSVHKILDEKLKRRNVAAHPSGIAINQHTAEEFVLDLIENVVLKL